jgi:cytochrome c5
VVYSRDTHFISRLAVVIGLLHVAVLIFFFLARAISQNTQVTYLLKDDLSRARTVENIEPFARVAIAGQDNAQLAIAPVAPTQGVAVALPQDGIGVYALACAACHTAGIAGAPKLADAGAWRERIQQGNEVLYQHAVQGFAGNAGVMPAKGGRTDLSDELVTAAVDYMVEQVPSRQLNNRD